MLGRGLVATVHDSGLVLAEGLDSQDGAGVVFVATRFATAFATNDIDGVVALLTDDAWFTMPPVTLEYQGPEAIASFLRDISSLAGARGTTG